VIVCCVLFVVVPMKAKIHCLFISSCPDVLSHMFYRQTLLIRENVHSLESLSLYQNHLSSDKFLSLQLAVL